MTAGAVEAAVRSLDVECVRLGEALVGSGSLSPLQLEKALSEQQRRFMPLSHVLVEAGVSQDDIERAISEVERAA